ncbi:TPA: hypothetical protein P5S08_003732 [Salmonella enterica subsp. enterica serovar Concord]|nr:hypothetical protein [Salmonella enterica subsp. enterica serovar Concord]
MKLPRLFSKSDSDKPESGSLKTRLTPLAVATSLAAVSSSAFALDPVAPDPSTVITTAMLSNIATPILVTMGTIVTAAFGILTLKLVVTVGMGLVKTFFTKAAA